MTFQTHRTEGVLDARLARQKVLVFIGAGSLGSEVLMQFGYEWGQLVIIDPDVLKAHNIERHRLGRSYLGQPKAPAMRDYMIKEFGLPSSSISAFVDIAENVLPRLRKVDLILSCIDNAEANRAIDKWCKDNSTDKDQKIAIYGGIYPRGAACEVISVPDARDVCFKCTEKARSDSVTAPKHVQNYGIDPDLVRQTADKPAAVPALRRSVTAAAADMAHVAWPLIFRQKGDKPKATILYHSLEEWIPIFMARYGSAELASVAKIMDAENQLGVEKSVKLGQMDRENYFPVQILRRYWPREVMRWDRCSNHGETSSVSDY
jgi:molybdopterin/thiamine biosynthesis adenylyltransferase